MGERRGEQTGGNKEINENSRNPVKLIGEKQSEGPTPAIEADLLINSDVTAKE